MKERSLVSILSTAIELSSHLTFFHSPCETVGDVMTNNTVPLDYSRELVSPLACTDDLETRRRQVRGAVSFQLVSVLVRVLGPDSRVVI